MKRDIQGKFTLKNDDYREVRSLRLTDATWKAMGIAASNLGITRADLLEKVVRDNNLVFPVPTGEKSWTVEQMEEKQIQVLNSLRLGKQSTLYKTVQKALRQFIDLLVTLSSK